MATLKDAMTSFDLRRMVAELQVLVGGYLDKVYQEGDEFFLRFHLPREGRREVYHRVGRWLTLREVGEKPDAPGAMAQALRKALPNPRVLAVEQQGFDRIVTLELAQGQDRYLLLMEMFGKGNLLFLRERKILQVFRPQSFRNRELKPGASYQPPPAGLNPLALDADGFRRTLAQNKKGLVKALATDFNLGGLYAEEVCLRANVPKDARPQGLGDMELGTLHAVLQGLGDESLAGPSGLVVEGGKLVDALPCALRVYATMEFRPTGSLSEALGTYLAAIQDEVPEDEATEKLRRRLKAQEGTLGELATENEGASRTTELIYAHYAEVEEFLRRAREHAQGKVTLELEGVTMELDPTLGVDANAQRYYDRRKFARDKAVRVEEAIAQTRGELGRRERRARRPAEPTVRATKRFWFEAYRWFISRDGFLCIGGRDAKSNDKLVKRHLQDGDRYAHADIPGAPSVVVKGGSAAPEGTLREACQFSLLHSRAWTAGLATGSAYWVLPEQVSKRAESGEFLRTGSFVIRGKRNYVHDLPVEAGVGEFIHEGSRKVMAGPPSALEGRSGRWVLLRPGRGAREGVARALAQEFQVPLVEIQAILPAGPMDVAARHGAGAEEPGNRTP